MKTAPALALACLTATLAACPSSAPSGTSSGAGTSGANTTGGGLGTTGGNGGTCVGNACVTDAGCCLGYQCNAFTLSCCAIVGSPCINDEDCCNTFCNEETGFCVTSLISTSSSGSGTSAGTIGTGSTTATTTAGTTSSGSSSTAASGGSGSSSSGSSGTGGGASLDFTWTFGLGQSCELAQVGWVALELLDAGTADLLPCRSPAGVEGATVPAPTAFQNVGYRLLGFDPLTGTQLALASGTTSVPLAGATDVSASLALADGGPSAVRLLWSFGGQTCAAAGVSAVHVSLQDPDEPALDVDAVAPCEDGGVEGISLPGYGAGELPVSLSAVTDAGTFQASGTAIANGLSNAQVHVDLGLSDGGGSGDVGIAFSFGGLGCLAAGFDSVSLQLVTPNGSALAPAVNVSCADAGTSTLFSSVPAPATGILWLEGSAQGQVQSLAEVQLVVVPGATASYTVTGQPAP